MNCIYNIYNKEAFNIPSANWNYVEIKWVVKGFSYVEKDEVLGSIIYKYIPLNRILSTKEHVFNLVSPCNGYLYFIQQGDFNFIIERIREWENKPLACIFDNKQELVSFYYCYEDSTLETDPYTGRNRIEFDNGNGGWKHQEAITLDDLDYLKVEFYEDKMLFCFDIYDKLKIGDCISLLFDDGKIIDFPITTKPEKISANRCKTTFISYQEDVETILYSTLVSYRVSFKDESTRPRTVTIGDSLLDGPEAIRAYVKGHLDAIKLLVPDYQLPRRTVAKTPIEYKFNWCYVYLMRDNTNGYHKIGISNKPEYREKTLQSEKPSIEMLACKKFPTRKIAEAIESALHTAYSQQRVRGEWFNLNDEDVAAIIETLK